jgi:hypothetical protein
MSDSLEQTSLNVTNIYYIMGTILSKARLQVKCSLWGRVLLEKVTVPLVVKKFPAHYGTQMFMTAFRGTPQLSLSLAKAI